MKNGYVKNFYFISGKGHIVINKRKFFYERETVTPFIKVVKHDPSTRN